MNYLDMYLCMMESSETINNLFTSLERNIAYTSVSNESAAYYSLANEAVIDRIKDICKAIGSFIMKIAQYIKNFLIKAFDSIKKALFGKKIPDADIFYLHKLDLKLLKDAVQQYETEVKEYFDVVNKAVSQRTFDTEKVNREINFAENVLKSLEDTRNDKSEYKKHFKSSTTLVAATSKSKAEDIRHKNLSEIDDLIFKFKKINEGWAVASCHIQTIKSNDLSTISDFKAFMNASRKYAQVHSHIALGVISLLRKDINNLRIWEDKAEAEEYVDNDLR